MVSGETEMRLGNSDYIMISDNSAEKLVDRAAALVAAAKGQEPITLTQS